MQAKAERSRAVPARPAQQTLDAGRGGPRPPVQAALRSAAGPSQAQGEARGSVQPGGAAVRQAKLSDKMARLQPGHRPTATVAVGAAPPLQAKLAPQRATQTPPVVDGAAAARGRGAPTVTLAALAGGAGAAPPRGAPASQRKAAGGYHVVRGAALPSLAAPALERPPASSQPQQAGGAAASDPAERQADEIGSRIGQDLGSVSSISSGPLPRDVRSVAEKHTGVNLANTQLHAGPASQSYAEGQGALAVTEGRDVHFARGELSSGSSGGRALIGHELTHVAQQVHHGVAGAPQLKQAPKTDGGGGGGGGAGGGGGGGGGAAAAPAAPAPAGGGAAPAPAMAPGKGAAPGGGGRGAKPAAAPGGAGGGGEGGGGAAAAPGQAPAAAIGGGGGGGGGAPGAAGGGGVEPLMPPVPMQLSPEEEARLAAAGGRAGAAADAKTDLPAAGEKTEAARGAVTEPASEVAARAQAAFIALLDEQPHPDPELVRVCNELRSAIAQNRPTSEKEIQAANPQATAQAVGKSVSGQVEAGAKEAGAQAEKIQTPPGGQPTLQPQAIANPPADAPAPDVAANQAKPNEIPPANVSLDADVKASDQKLRDAGMKSDPAKEAAKAGEGPLATAQQAEGQLGELAKTAPEQVLADQKAALAKADAGMLGLQSQTMAALLHSRETGISGDRGKQDKMVLSEQQKRDKASSDAKAIYDQARTDVTGLIEIMPGKIRGKWDAGIASISSEFETSLSTVKGWIKQRYADVGGLLNQLGDFFTGLPDWIVAAYRNAERKFGDDVCSLALDVSTSINGTMLAIDKIISNAKARIDDIFDSLGPDLAVWAAEQKAGFEKDFSGLREKAHQQAAELQTELRTNAVQSVQDARQKIKELRDSTKGLLEQLEEAATEFAADPAKFIINGLLKLVGIAPDAFWAVVAKVQQVAKDIADDPMRFANNLAAGLKLGFQQFFGNIGTHLLQGLVDWLFSALKDVGVEAPKDLSLRSIVTVFLQIMGITWPRIRKIIAKHVGEKNVAMVEKAWAMISQLIELGPEGIFELIKEKLDPKSIMDAVLSAAKDYIIKVLVEKVSVKIIAMFNPVGAIAQAVIAIYDILKWVFNNAAKIFSLVETVVNGMADVISGNIGGVAAAVEKALAGLLGPVIGLLAELVGLGDLPAAIADVIRGLQDQVAAILDEVIGFLVEKAKALLAALTGGKEQKPDERTEEQKEEDLGKGIAEADALLAADQQTPLGTMDDKLVAIKARYRMTSLEFVVVSEDMKEGVESVRVHGAINPEKDGEPKPHNLKELVQELHPINYRYRGQEVTILSGPLKGTTVYYDSNGFPDFSPFALKTVTIKMHGNRSYRVPDGDFGNANEKAGYERNGGEPSDHTWHHHQDRQTMQLVPFDIHDAFRHSGGVWVISELKERK